MSLAAWTWGATTTRMTPLAHVTPRLSTRLEDHFRKLYVTFAGEAAQPVMPALASALNCNEGNARSILRKMESRGWLRGETARGRGRFSQSNLLATPQDIELKHESDLWRKVNRNRRLRNSTMSKGFD